MTLELDKYELDNLVALLKVVRSGNAGPLNTGDWCGQIYWKLTDGKGFDPGVHDPNQLPDFQVKQIENYWRYRLGVK